MKSRATIKYFLIGAILTFLGILISSFYRPNIFILRKEESMIRVGFPYRTNLEEFDPARVQVASQYALLENLYLPLLLKNQDGLLIPGAAAKFSWVDDEIEFVIRDDLYDSGGVKITVDDAYFSLMRLLILGSGTHGDLAQLLCPAGRPIDLQAGCDGIKIIDGKLRLKPKEKNFSIFENFSTIDFAIIPKRSVDPSNLSKINLGITSGPYYVKERRADGTLILEANHKHYLYSENMPQSAAFIPTADPSLAGIKSFENGLIDYLSAVDQSDIEERLDRYQNSPIAYLHQTLPVRLELIVFTSKGLKKPSSERWEIGNLIAKFVEKIELKKSGRQLANQYFPPGGKGSLSDNELLEINQKRERTTTNPATVLKKFTLGLFTRNFEGMRAKLESAFPGLKIVNIKMLPAYDSNVDSADYPDFYIVSMDTGFLESLPNVANSVKSGFLGENETDRNAWLGRYLSTSEEEKRIALLKEIHRRSLLSPVIIPVVRTPYVAVIRKPWKPNFSFLFPDSPLWQISKN